METLTPKTFEQADFLGQSVSMSVEEACNQLLPPFLKHLKSATAKSVNAFLIHLKPVSELASTELLRLEKLWLGDDWDFASTNKMAQSPWSFVLN